MSVEIEIRSGVCIISLNDGKLNCMSTSIRRGLLDALDTAASEKACKAVVLIGRGKAFSAGADLNELNSANPLTSPGLSEVVFPAIEEMRVPVIAAMHGSAMGGGLELALACSYRVASPDTMLGLPEVNLGLIPGAGGTQRLPRAVGVETALNLILAGKVFSARKAPPGLLDHIVEGDLLEGAVDFALEVADIRPIPRLLSAKLKLAENDRYFEIARSVAKTDPRRLPGLLPVINLVEAATKLHPAKALEAEFEAFKGLMRGDSSPPFRHVFLAERASAFIPGVDPTSARTIRKVAIVGAGTMGAGIAITLAEGGFDVHILDVNPAALERGLAHCRTIWERRMAKGQIAIEQCEALVLRVQGVQEYEQIADCDLVIEAVVEQMDVKKAVFAALDKALKPGAILATNTSTLNVDEIAEVTNRPSDVIGLHFFSPANIMQLLEIVRGKKTAPDVLASALALAKKIRKIPVVSGVCDGFIGNRMVDRYVAQAMYLIEEGATPQQVDQALERWGMAMGPFRMNDIVGNDVPWDGRKHRRAQNPDTKFPSIADEICERGWFGQKTGLGWYKYFPNQRKAEPNPELQDILSALSAKLGVTRREITDEEIVQRCIFALVNEAAAILDEGIAQRGSDIDVAYIFGYGFPRFRGGPLFFADHFGLYAMIRRMRQFTKCHGDPDVWTPYPLLVSLADAEQKISNYEVPT